MVEPYNQDLGSTHYQKEHSSVQNSNIISNYTFVCYLLCAIVCSIAQHA